MKDQFVILPDNFPDFQAVWDELHKTYPEYNWTKGPPIDDIEANLQFWPNVKVLITANSQLSAFAIMMNPKTTAIFEVHYGDVQTDLMSLTRANNMEYHTALVADPTTEKLDPKLVSRAVENMIIL